MDTNFYDVVVCGGDLPGLIAGAILGRRGLRVLLCGHDRVSGTFSAAGYTLPCEPGLLPPPELEHVARVMRELNYSQIIRRRAPALSPPFQIILPDHRLNFGGNAQDMERELTREFPGEESIISAALGRLRAASATLDPILGSDITLPPDSFWERREVARVEGYLPPPGTDLWAPLPARHPLRAALSACAALSCGLGPGEIGRVAEARALDIAMRGLCRVEGGGSALRGLFLDKIDTYSSDIREKTRPVQIIGKRGRITGLRVEPRDETIGLANLIWAGPASSLLPVCGDEVPKRLKEIAATIRPACYRYVLCLLVGPKAIPEGMGPRLFSMLDPDRPAIEDNALAFTVGAPSPREPDRVAVWVEALIPAAAAAIGPGYFAVVRARIREHIATVIPFFEQHMLVLASPHDGLPPELPAGTRTPIAPAPIPPLPMAPALNCDLPRMLQVGGAPHASGLKNVYLASAENLPGLGREGDFVSAWGIVRMILGSQDHRGAGKRDILIEDG